MHIVIISHTFDPMSDLTRSQTEISRLREILSLLRTAAVSLSREHQDVTQSFLVSTPVLLRVLRESPPFPAQVTLRVFSLSSPDMQLVGTVTTDNQASPESYILGGAPDQRQ